MNVVVVVVVVEDVDCFIDIMRKSGGYRRGVMELYVEYRFTLSLSLFLSVQYALER